jgi:hypothetical protein
MQLTSIAKKIKGLAMDSQGVGQIDRIDVLQRMRAGNL